LRFFAFLGTAAAFACAGAATAFLGVLVFFFFGGGGRCCCLSLRSPLADLVKTFFVAAAETDVAARGGALVVGAAANVAGGATL
jgi:hypothetical protein